MNSLCWDHDLQSQSRLLKKGSTTHATIFLRTWPRTWKLSSSERQHNIHNFISLRTWPGTWKLSTEEVQHNTHLPENKDYKLCLQVIYTGRAAQHTQLLSPWRQDLHHQSRRKGITTHALFLRTWPWAWKLSSRKGQLSIQNSITLRTWSRTRKVSKEERQHNTHLPEVNDNKQFLLRSWPSTSKLSTQV